MTSPGSLPTTIVSDLSTVISTTLDPSELSLVYLNESGPLTTTLTLPSLHRSYCGYPKTCSTTHVQPRYMILMNSSLSKRPFLPGTVYTPQTSPQVYLYRDPANFLDLQLPLTPGLPRDPFRSHTAQERGRVPSHILLFPSQSCRDSWSTQRS